MKYLIIIHIGPVQTFLAAARKIRDLAAGSAMLSKMAAAVAESLQSSGCELIFPATIGDGAVPNKIMVSSPDDANVKRMVTKARNAAKRARDAFFANASNDKYVRGAISSDLFGVCLNSLEPLWVMYLIPKANVTPRLY